MKSKRNLAVALLGAVTCLPACRVSHETSYATPLDTVLSFQTAYAHNDEVAEYQCLAQPVRSEVPLAGYAVLRSRLLEPLGSAGRWVLSRNSLHDNLLSDLREDGRSRLLFSLFSREFEVLLQREPRFHVVVANDAATTVEASPAAGDLVWVGRADEAFRVTLSLPADLVDTLRSDGIREVMLEGDWKVITVEPVASPEHPAPTPVSEPPHYSMEGPSIAWEAGPVVLGEALVTLKLPLPPHLGPRDLATVNARVHWRVIAP